MRKDRIQKKAAELNLTTVEVRKGEIEGSHKEVDQLLTALGLSWGGYTTGYGTLVVRKDYVLDLEDFNSVYSRHHY